MFPSFTKAPLNLLPVTDITASYLLTRAGPPSMQQPTVPEHVRQSAAIFTDLNHTIKIEMEG